MNDKKMNDKVSRQENERQENERHRVEAGKWTTRKGKTKCRGRKMNDKEKFKQTLKMTDKTTRLLT